MIYHSYSWHAFIIVIEVPDFSLIVIIMIYVTMTPGACISASIASFKVIFGLTPATGAITVSVTILRSVMILMS